jgi:integrase
LEFTILACSRTSETLGATWEEIDLDEKTWTIPAHRIKSGKEHQAALSKAAVAVLRKARTLTEKIGGPVGASNLVFPNDRSGKQLSENSLSSILVRMKYDDITVHGMRSVFRDFAVKKHISRMTLLKWRWRIGSETRPNKRTGEKPDCRNVANSRKRGRTIAASLRSPMPRC